MDSGPLLFHGALVPSPYIERSRRMGIAESARCFLCWGHLLPGGLCSSAFSRLPARVDSWRPGLGPGAEITVPGRLDRCAGCTPVAFPSPERGILILGGCICPHYTLWEAVSWAGLGWDFSLPRARCPVGRLCGRGCLWAECVGRDLRLPGQCLVCRACPGQKSPSLCPASSGGAAVDTAQALGSHRPGMGPARI